MKKIVRKIGSSVGFIFNKEECLLNNISVEDVIDFDINSVQKKQEEVKYGTTNTDTKQSVGTN